MGWTKDQHVWNQKDCDELKLITISLRPKGDYDEENIKISLRPNRDYDDWKIKIVWDQKEIMMN